MTASRTAIAVFATALLATRPGIAAPPDDVACALLAGTCPPPPYVAVMSAFPAEIEPLLAAATISETIVGGERTYYVGTLAGTSVVLVRGGIGLANAANTARALVDRFALEAIVFSGVAGSTYDIGDVIVPSDWTDGTASYPSTPALLDVARTLVPSSIALEQCTAAPPEPPGPTVCLGRTPQIVVGGTGESSDPFGTTPFACVPDGGPIFGCAPLRADVGTPRGTVAPVTMDMETAAVAHVAQDAGLPFIGFRGVSDGAGDPLNLTGFLQQFSVYYKLSADNAAAVTIAFLAARKAAQGSAAAMSDGPPGIAAACDWPRTAGAACAGARPPGAATGQVSAACRFLSTATALPGTPDAARARKLARKHWRHAARLVAATPGRKLGKGCRRPLVQLLRGRASVATP